MAEEPFKPVKTEVTAFDPANRITAGLPDHGSPEKGKT